MRQLQAEGMAEVTVKRVAKRVAVARAPEAGGAQPPRQAPAGAKGAGAKGAAATLSSRWAQKLDSDQQLMEKRKQRLEGKLQKRVEKGAWQKQLRLEPRLLSRKLASQLQHWEQGAPRSPWEEQLAQLLQEAPHRLSSEAAAAPADRGPESRLEGQQQRLLSFFECCLLTGHLPLAHHVLVTHHSKSQQQRLLTLSMYNMVMLGWARQVSDWAQGASAPGSEAEANLRALRFEPLSFSSRAQAFVFYCFNNSLGLSIMSHTWPSKQSVKMTKRAGRSCALVQSISFRLLDHGSSARGAADPPWGCDLSAFHLACSCLELPRWAPSF